MDLDVEIKRIQNAFELMKQQQTVVPLKTVYGQWRFGLSGYHRMHSDFYGALQFATSFGLCGVGWGSDFFLLFLRKSAIAKYGRLAHSAIHLCGALHLANFWLAHGPHMLKLSRYQQAMYTRQAFGLVSLVISGEIGVWGALSAMAYFVYTPDPVSSDLAAFFAVWFMLGWFERPKDSMRTVGAMHWTVWYVLNVVTMFCGAGIYYTTRAT